MLRRCVAGFLVCWVAVTGQARAQEAYPNKPIRLVIAFAVGGATDITARILAPKLSELLGQRVLVDNRPGAGAVIGTDLVAKSAPDGYTLLLGEVSSFGINPWIYKNIPYDSLTDFAPVGEVVTSSFVLVVHHSLPATDLASFIALMKANPGKYSYGSAGIGSMPHLCAEMLKSMAGGLDITHVPYRGAGPVMNDLSAGQISMSFPTPSTALPQIEAGTIRAIGAGPLKRERTLPNLPTLDEQGLKGFECYNFFGIVAPAKTPERIVQRLNAAINTALADSTLALRLQELGLDPTPGTSPEKLGDLIRTERAKWGPVIKALGTQLD
ncbi:MAG: tripartite tricarboxylate transporter substrate binding protein [Alphaproteobacteria bacterium]|nr:tripartite tricarboxylate transporter substrate binding protein [Alphaproteobacteria bacterium]